MLRVLLVVSADAQADRACVERGLCPRRDYLELAELLNADVFDFGGVQRHAAGGVLRRMLGGGLAHALLARLRLGSYDAVFSDSEHVGLFLGMLMRAGRRRPRHVLLAHHLTPRKKHLFARLARPAIDALIVHAGIQRQFAIERLGFAPERVHVLPYQSDPTFWQPASDREEELICSAGLECRDYATLLEAVDGLPVRLNIGAASHWSRKRNLIAGRALPASVTVESYDYPQLRDLYARSRFVAVPLLDVDFQAGIMLLLEAMAMGKAVLVTRTRGQTETVVGPVWDSQHSDAWPSEGPPAAESTGIYLRPGDAAAWRGAMRFLLAHPEVAATLGANGRRAVEERYTVDQFARRLAALIAPENAHG